MTLLIKAVCLFIINGGAIIPVSVGATIGTVITGVKIWILGDSTSRAISTAIGSSASAGATTVAMFDPTFQSLVTGAAVCSMAAGAFAFLIAGMAKLSKKVTVQAVGMLAVGTNVNEAGDQLKYDCWKSVVRDNSEHPSDGMLLKDLVRHPNVSQVNIDDTGYLPHIFIKNIWGETFEIEYVVTSKGVSCHARQIEC